MTEKPDDDVHIDAEHEPELTDEDILDAMRHIPGYLDISTEDFRIIYHLAWRHAVARLLARKDGQDK
jgi:CBS domain-containing membrane protein